MNMIVSIVIGVIGGLVLVFAGVQVTEKPLLFTALIIPWVVFWNAIYLFVIKKD